MSRRPLPRRPSRQEFKQRAENVDDIRNVLGVELHEAQVRSEGCHICGGWGILDGTDLVLRRRDTVRMDPVSEVREEGLHVFALLQPQTNSGPRHFRDWVGFKRGAFVHCDSEIPTEESFFTTTTSGVAHTQYCTLVIMPLVPICSTAYSLLTGVQVGLIWLGKICVGRLGQLADLPG